MLKVISKEVRGKRAACLRGFLKSLSWIFSVIVQLRLLLFRHRIIRASTLGCQVISVGNVTVGGTGKTPIVETFARSLQQKGRKVAILSRGYKSRRTPLWEKILKKEKQLPRVVSDGERLLLNSDMAGDEPYMLASNLPDVVVLVDKDRVKSGKYAIREFGCDTLVLDDGFQYLKLQHRLDIVLVDYTNPFGYNRVLPREGCPVIANWRGEGDPALAVGQFGKGRVLAYTSDPAPHWGCNFVFWKQYAQLWVNACKWLVVGGASISGA